MEIIEACHSSSGCIPRAAPEPQHESGQRRRGVRLRELATVRLFRLALTADDIGKGGQEFRLTAPSLPASSRPSLPVASRASPASGHDHHQGSWRRTGPPPHPQPPDGKKPANTATSMLLRISRAGWRR